MLSFFYELWNNFWGVTLPTVHRFSLYKRKSSELWLVHNPELRVFKQLEILLVPCQYILSLMSLINCNQENYEIHLYTILI